MAVFDEIFNPIELQQYVMQREYETTLGETLFPNRKDDVTDIDYIIGANNVPVAASIRAKDSETQIASRQAGGERFVREIYTIARKIPQTETQIINLNKAVSSAEIQRYKESVFNDMDAMVESVRVTIEALRYAALFDGKIVFNEYGYAGTLDYGVPSEHKVVPAVKWDAPSGATILENLQAWMKLLRADGVIGTRILTSTDVLDIMLNDAILKEYIFGSNNKLNILGVTELNSWLRAKGLPAIAVDDRIYRIEKNSGKTEDKTYVPYGKLVIMGSEAPGYTQFGLTAEELELRGMSDVDTQDFGFIIGNTYKQVDPVTRWTKATARALPSFPQAGRVIQANVLVPKA